jgi:hypothetical protein
MTKGMAWLRRIHSESPTVLGLGLLHDFRQIARILVQGLRKKRRLEDRKKAKRQKKHEGGVSLHGWRWWVRHENEPTNVLLFIERRNEGGKF